MKIGLAVKILLILEGVLIISAVLSGLITHGVLNDVLVKESKNSITSIFELKKQHILLFISDAKEEIRQIADSAEIVKQIASILEKQTPKDDRIFANIRRNLIAERSYVLDLLLLSPEGIVISSSKQSEQGQNYSSQPFFREGKHTIFFQKYAYDVELMQNIMTISTPVIQEGKVIAVLMAKMSQIELNKLMTDRVGLRQSGETFLIDTDNRVTTPLIKEKDAEFRRKIELPQVERCLKGENQFGENRDYSGAEVIGLWQWVPEIQSCMVTKFDKSEVLAPMKSVRLIILVVTVVLLNISGYLSWLAVTHITKNLLKLRDISQKVSQGISTPFEPINSADEVGDLSRAFSHMIGEVDRGRKELETKVAERTKAAEDALSQMESQNKELEGGRLAILNILEDQKRAEELLIQEKTSIEQKVEERTLELGQEKARLIAAISSLPEAFIIIDKNNQLVVYNNKLSKHLGESKGIWTIDEVDKRLGRNINLQDCIDTVVRERKNMKEKEIAVGSKFFRVFIAPILPGLLSETNEIVGSIISIADVTEDRLMARARDEFFSIASHELRTPLTAIRGNTSMILDYYGKEIEHSDIRQMIVDTHSSSVRLISIVNDFLNMSRLEQKKVEYTFASVSVLPIVKKIIGELAGMASEKGIVILSDIDEDVIVWADVEKVEQIYINLIGNSLKFTQQGLIKLSAQKVGDTTQLSISDTGKGIPIENQSLLFRKFQQAASSTITRETVQGTGLGLYISRLMAEGMKGTLNLVQSTEGKGSTFCLTLPAHEMKL